MTRANGQLTLTWDGPYDIDGQKVRITLFADGRQIGDRIEVKRGVQTAAIPGIEPGKEYSIQFQSVDLSGNVSKGITVESKEQPVYSLTVGGHALKDGDSFTDDAVLTLQAGDGLLSRRFRYAWFGRQNVYGRFPYPKHLHRIGR